MNCKPGDSAVVVRSYAGNYGHFVTCVRLATKEDFLAMGYGPASSPAWITNETLRNSAGRFCCYVYDDQIRPIRDQPGNEEFVVKARKTLPRPIPVPGPVTIDERGEV